MAALARTGPAGTPRGQSLVEWVLALALAGVLAAAAGLAPVPGSPGLGAVQGELRAAVEQGFRAARDRGVPVRLALGPDAASGADGDLPPLVLPRGVRWGLPHPSAPLPPGMDAPVHAHRAGAAHPVVTLHPEGTAQANVWFLTDGRDAVCLRLAGDGGLTLLRWRRRTGRWEAL